MKDEKQIEKILEKYGILFPVRASKEIASLYEGWYPGEFIVWWFTKGLMEFAIVGFSEPVLFTKFNEGSQRKYTLPELFKWWQDNVEGK